MISGFNTEFLRVIALAIICSILGLISGQLSWSLIIGGALYMSWMLWQMYQLDRWLNDSQQQSIPEASGIWGDIFSKIHHLQSQQLQEKSRLQTQISRMQDSTASLKDGFILLDKLGRVEWRNPACQRLLGLESSDRGRPLLSFINQSKFSHYYEDGDYREPLRLVSPRNPNRHLEYQISRYGRGERLIILRDITHVLKLEQMRRDFVGNLSHELRTPLTVICGYLETLADSGQLPDNWCKPFEQMQHQSKRMSLIVNDLIMLSKLETEETERQYQPVELKALLDTIANEARALSNKQHSIVVAGEALSINGCEQELHSAISNLAFNAVKYTPAGSEIVLSANLSHQAVEIAVSDNGPGIEVQHLHRLTERFYRVDSSRSRQSGGTGLGLAIVKHILLRHDGLLDISSELGQGSCFKCLLPLNLNLTEPGDD